LAGIQAGFWESVEQARGSIEEKTVDRPIQRNAEIYNRLFEVYKNLYPHLTGIFTDLNPFQKTGSMSKG
jgi:hypothetical protein